MPQDTTVTAVQDQLLGAIRTTHEATVNVCRTWARTFASVTPSVFDMVLTPKVESFNGFAENLWDGEREFFASMCEVAAEMGRAIPESAERYAAAAGAARPAAKS